MDGDILDQSYVMLFGSNVIHDGRLVARLVYLMVCPLGVTVKGGRVYEGGVVGATKS